MTKVKGHTEFPGYLWKYCPFSTNHKNKYYSNGWHGNTNNQDILATTNLSSITTADHPTTDGTMNMRVPAGAGWICLDNNCPYYTTNGVYYFET